MEETDLRHLLRSRRGHRLWRGCPGETRLAAYADRRLGGADRASIERHLAGCRRCLAQVSFLARSAEWPPPEAVPSHLLVRARNLAPSRERTTPLQGWRWAATAAAVCLLLTIGFIAALRLRGPNARRAEQPPLIAQQQPARDAAAPVPAAAPTPDTARVSTPAVSAARPPATAPAVPKSARAPALRRAEANGFAPTMLSPRDGAALKRGAAEFRWQPAADALFYEVFVVTEAGDIVLEQRSEKTRLRLPADAPMTPGAKYFVWVRAYLREGKTANSGVVSFRLAE